MSEKKLIIIGIDGAVPKKVQELMEKGRLPNLKKLSETGCFSKLKTTHVSQSPVAWSSFTTGLNPGKHGLYDFITRDPETMALQLGLNKEIIDVQGRSVYQGIRKGIPFWNVLGEAGHKAISLFIPVTFPPEEFGGALVSGMGVPDLRGTQGVPTVYTTKNIQKQDVVQIQNSKNIKSVLLGPRESKIPISFEFSSGSATIKVQENEISLKENEWSDWLKVNFELERETREGVCRFKLIESSAEKTIYCSPIMISPFNPFTPITYPFNLSAEIAQKQGVYKNNSFESDVHALKEEIIDESTYLEDLYYTMESRFKVLKHFLDQEWDFICINFFLVDRAQHMFMRFVDPEHPYYEKSEKYKGEIDRAYEKMDSVVGEILEKVPEDAIVFVISDHGFGSYRYGVDINRLLHNKGLISYNSDGSTLFDANWDGTKAFACGFSGVYLNLKGRETRGIVNENEIAELKEKIKNTLLNFQYKGENVFLDVKFKEEIYSGDIENFPELIPFYAYGFRASKATALGGIGSEEGTAPNMNKWAGDHIGPGDPEKWAGIIMCNKELNLENASIMDLAPTVLEYFGTNVPEMDGKSLWK